MIQITPHIRILLALEPVDFRKGIDGLAGVCTNILNQDPFTGHMFIFRNKRGTSIKILLYDGQGFWLCQKRFSKGHLNFWPDKSSNDSLMKLEPHQLQMLIWNVNFQRISCSKWKNIKKNKVKLIEKN